MLPSFGVVAPTFHETDPPPLDLPGCDIDLAQVVHGSQSISVTRPIPTSGSATVTTRISEIWDKGKAAVIWQEGVATAPSGEELWTTRSSIFVRGEGGWGGDRGRSAPVELPDRAPDVDTTYARLAAAGAALPTLRRPQPAARRPRTSRRPPASRRRSCTGCAPTASCSARSPTQLLDGDTAQVAGFGVKFAGVVFPGETIRIRAWREDDRIVASATVAGGDRDGAPVLADVVLTTAA